MLAELELESRKQITDHAIIDVILIGKCIKPASPRGGQLALDEVLIHDRF